MSEELKDKEKKHLTIELLQKQIEASKSVIGQAQQQIERLTKQVEQQFGVLQYAQHLLSEFEIPNEPKPEEPKKTDLEVK